MTDEKSKKAILPPELLAIELRRIATSEATYRRDPDLSVLEEAFLAAAADWIEQEVRKAGKS